MSGEIMNMAHGINAVCLVCFGQGNAEESDGQEIELRGKVTAIYTPTDRRRASYQLLALLDSLLPCMGWTRPYDWLVSSSLHGACLIRRELQRD